MENKKIMGVIKLTAITTALMSMIACAPLPTKNFEANKLTTQNYPVVNSANVVLASNKPNCTYSSVGTITVRDVNVLGMARSSQNIRNDLQQNAGLMGGNAVIGVNQSGEFYQGTIVYIHDLKRCASLQAF